MIKDEEAVVIVKPKKQSKPPISTLAPPLCTQIINAMPPDSDINYLLVEHLKKAIATDEYSISPEAIAKKILSCF